MSQPRVLRLLCCLTQNGPLPASVQKQLNSAAWLLHQAEALQAEVVRLRAALAAATTASVCPFQLLASVLFPADMREALGLLMAAIWMAWLGSMLVAGTLQLSSCLGLLVQQQKRVSERGAPLEARLTPLCVQAAMRTPPTVPLGATILAAAFYAAGAAVGACQGLLRALR